MSSRVRGCWQARQVHVAALAQRVLDAGAGRVDFGTPHGLTDGAGVALLGTRVLPLLRR
jgi:5,10-methylenetetrahydromethanopterin reductase